MSMAEAHQLCYVIQSAAKSGETAVRLYTGKKKITCLAFLNVPNLPKQTSGVTPLHRGKVTPRFTPWHLSTAAAWAAAAGGGGGGEEGNGGGAVNF